MDKEGCHLLTCKFGRGPVWNTILACWSECLNELQICHPKESRNRYMDLEDCLDIVLFDLGSGNDIEIDISMAHPWSSDTIKQARQVNGHAPPLVFLAFWPLGSVCTVIFE